MTVYASDLYNLIHSQPVAGFEFPEVTTKPSIRSIYLEKEGTVRTCWGNIPSCTLIFFCATAATGMKNYLQTNMSYICLVSHTIHTHLFMAKVGLENPHVFFTLSRRPRLSAIFADCKCSTRQSTMRTKSTERTIQSTWEDGRPWFNEN